MSILVQLRQFEGPLSLLLYLIRKEEMDIFDINIYEITRQYLEYIQLMRELDLELAGDFVAMAATLIHIKYRMLLPQYNEEGEETEQDDPRKELVQKLLDYQKYQEAAHKLYERPLVNRDVWLRGVREEIEVQDDTVIVEDSGLFSLIAAYRQVLHNMKKGTHHVVSKMQSIASRILEIKDRLVEGRRVQMFELITEDPAAKRFQMLITFLALLELGKMGFVQLFQSDTYGDIFIETKHAIERDVISRVEEYDNHESSALAEQLTTAASEADLAEVLSEEIPADQMSEDAMVARLDHDAADADDFDSDAATDDEILAAERELANNEGPDEGSFVEG